jgi:hypothetical protein
MEMVKLVLVCALLPAAGSAADFSLTIGPPVAAAAGGRATKTKAALFAVRLEECAAPDKAQVSGVAEGIVQGMRMSVPVTLSEGESQGVYVVSAGWNQNQGVWVVSLNATCGNAKAGAIVPIGPSGFQRDGTKVFPRPAAKAEIDAALKALETPKP